MRTVLIAVISFSGLAGSVAAQQRLPDPVPPSLSELREIRSTYIIRFDPAVTGDEAPGLGRAIAARFGGEVRHVYSSTIIGAALKLSDQAVARLLAADDLGAIRIERDQVAMAYVRPPGAGPGNSNGGGGSVSGPSACTQTVSWGTARVLGAIAGTPADADLANACESDSTLGFAGDYSLVTGPVGGAGVSVCVLDTGVDLDHPDLNVSPGPHFSALTRGKDAEPNDLNGHGSHIAGTIGALSNDGGAMGVAPGAMITAVKVLDRTGSGSYSGVIAGVDWAAEHGCDVANMSLGGPVSSALNDAVLAAAEAGVFFALAAGNEAVDADTKSPASTNHFRITTVAASSAGDSWASFSNYGASVDAILPGASIFSTYKDGGYATGSGTSMAAPHMAGLLVRELVADPDRTPGVLADDADIYRVPGEKYDMPIDPRSSGLPGGGSGV